MKEGGLSVSQEWRRHWTLVVAAAVGFSFMAFMSPAIGLFMEPLQKEFGWSRSLLSSGPAIGAVLGLVLAPFFGAAIDRIGPRRMALPGLVLTAFAIAAFSQLSNSLVVWFGLWTIYAVCVLAVHATTWTTAVAGAFSSSRGLAIGLTMAGSAVGVAVVPPLTDWLIANEGWRSSFVWLGLGWGGLAFLLSWFFFFDARAAPPSSKKAALSTRDLPGLSVSEAWRNTALLRVALATLLILTITVGVNVHQVPILVDAGVTRTNAAWLASMGGIAGVIGKIVTGLLIDRFHVRWVGGITLASTTIAYPLLLEGLRTPELIAIAIIINGYAAGTKMQLCSYLTVVYGGLRNYGTIYGFMSSMIALAGGIGPILAGACFDSFGSYANFLIAGTAISLISGLLIFSLGRYPTWSGDAADGPA